MAKKIVGASIGGVGVVGFAALVDMITGIPFGKVVLMDVTFLIASGIVGYMAYDTLAEMK